MPQGIGGTRPDTSMYMNISEYLGQHFQAFPWYSYEYSYCQEGLHFNLRPYVNRKRRLSPTVIPSSISVHSGDEYLPCAQPEAERQKLFHWIYYRSIVVSLSVCLSVCLSASISQPHHTSKLGVWSLCPQPGRRGLPSLGIWGGRSCPLKSWSINAFCVMVTAYVMYFRF